MTNLENKKQLQGEKKMKRMREIIDVWFIIQDHDVKGWKQENGAICTPNEEYDRVYEEVKNKKYLENLIK